MRKTQLSVKGMHCSACESLIREVLEEEGALHVKVDVDKGVVMVEHNAVLTKDRMKHVIEQEGYEVLR